VTHNGFPVVRDSASGQVGVERVLAEARSNSNPVRLVSGWLLCITLSITLQVVVGLITRSHLMALLNRIVVEGRSEGLEVGGSQCSTAVQLGAAHPQHSLVEDLCSLAYLHNPCSYHHVHLNCCGYKHARCTGWVVRAEPAHDGPCPRSEGCA
jgi:hypothetical protein